MSKNLRSIVSVIFAGKLSAAGENMKLRAIVSWVVYAAVVVVVLLNFYGKGWAEVSRLSSQHAWQLRLTAIVAVLTLSILASAISYVLPARLRILRGLLAGILTGVLLWRLTEWVGDYYLGGAAHYDPHQRGRLMIEGYGMMVEMLGPPVIAVLAWIRAEVIVYGERR